MEGVLSHFSAVPKSNDDVNAKWLCKQQEHCKVSELNHLGITYACITGAFISLQAFITTVIQK